MKGSCNWEVSELEILAICSAIAIALVAKYRAPRSREDPEVTRATGSRRS